MINARLLSTIHLRNDFVFFRAATSALDSTGDTTFAAQTTLLRVTIPR
jgi:hypothetical protein